MLNLWYNTENSKLASRWREPSEAVRHSEVITMSASDPTTDLKLCRKCGKEYPATVEYFRISRHGNLSSPCRACYAEIKRAWRKANPDKVRQHKSESQKRNRDGANRRYQRWLDKHPGSRAAQYRNDPEPTKTRAHAWYVANKERAAIANKARNQRPEIKARKREQSRGKYNPNHRLVVVRYRARKRNLLDTFTASEWEFALRYFGHACAYCGSTERITADHFIPLNSPECPGTVAGNMIPACGHCNSSKCDRDPVAWLVERFGDYRAHEILAIIGAYSEYV